MSSLLKIMIAFTSILGIITVAGPAFSQTLPTTYAVAAFDDTQSGNDIDNIGVAPQSAGEDRHSGVSSSSSLTAPVAQTSAKANGINLVSNSYLSYFFEIVGPQRTVPIIVDGSVVSSASGTGSAVYFSHSSFGLRVDQNIQPFFLQFNSCTGNLSCVGYCQTSASCPNIKFNQPEQLQTNTIYEIAQLSYTQSKNNGDTSASVNSYVRFPKDFKGADKFKIVFSSGVGNMPPPNVRIPRLGNGEYRSNLP